MNFVPSEHQVAGHEGALMAGPIFAKRSSAQEIDFYTQATGGLSAEPELLGSHLAHWMPTFMGTMSQGTNLVDGAMVLDPEGVDRMDPPAGIVDLEPDPTENPYLVLSNLCHGYKHPCILDIKLGSVLTDDTVSASKRERLAAVSKSTTSGTLGFRICGMKIYGVEPSEPALLSPDLKSTMHTETTEDGGYYTKFDKMFGRLLDENTVGSALQTFFKKDLPLRPQLVLKFLQRLQLLYNCLLDTEVRIKSGSLLLIYEGDPAGWATIDASSYPRADPLVYDPLETDESDSESGSGSESESESESGAETDSRTAPLSRLSLIDFAHAKFTPDEGPDNNILDGVENLITLFEKLVESI